jgi:hypothetical protein
MGSAGCVQEVPPVRHARALELISAIAHKDAVPGDIAAQFRRERFDALDVQVAALARASAAPESRGGREQPIDVLRFTRPTPPAVVSRIVQRAPKVPFVLNGVIYDPDDVRRFDGRELHFVVACGGDYLVVVDDRGVMGPWWQSVYLSSLIDASPAASQSLNQTWLYENAGLGGVALALKRDRGYADLAEVGRGAFRQGDWRARIASLVLLGTGVCVLHEGARWQGSSLTVFERTDDLEPFGWSGRAASVETW